MNPGPIDLTPFGGMLRGAFSFLGLLYWGLFAYLLWRAVRKPGITGLQRAERLAWVLLFFGPLPAYAIWQDWQWYRRSQDAESRFQAHCKTAGEFIHRKVSGVQGVRWMKWRAGSKARVQAEEQFELYDPYGHDCLNGDCISALLRVSNVDELYRPALDPSNIMRENGFLFVESVDPKDGLLKRYTRVLVPDFYSRRTPTMDASGRRLPDGYHSELKSETIGQPTARYGVTWDDISTREDRERWIAGGSIKVIDLETQEVLAERRGYMRDIGLGSRAGFRDPWAYAVERACPPFVFVKSQGRAFRDHDQTLNFVRQALPGRRNHE